MRQGYVEIVGKNTETKKYAALLEEVRFSIRCALELGLDREAIVDRVKGNFLSVGCDAAESARMADLLVRSAEVGFVHDPARIEALRVIVFQKSCEMVNESANAGKA